MRISFASIALLFCAIILCFAGIVPGSNSPNESWSQMWNTSSVYYNTVTSRSQIGSQLDTATTSVGVRLSTSQFTIQTGHVNVDTVTSMPLNGGSSSVISSSLVTYACTAVTSLNPTVVARFQGSTGGTAWSTIQSFTLSPVGVYSVNTPAVASYTGSKRARFYRWDIDPSSLSSVSCWSSWYNQN